MSKWRETTLPGKHASAIDAESMTVTMDGDPLEESQIERARRTVAGWVARENMGAQELSDLMRMLGLFPDQQKPGDVHATSRMPSTLPGGK